MINITTGSLVGDRTQIYLTDISDDTIEEIFNGNPGKYVFRHTDCPVVFITDGSFIYSEDMDALNTDPVERYGPFNISYIYNDFNEFINIFKYIEELLGRELFLADWNNHSDISIRALELEFKKRTHE